MGLAENRRMAHSLEQIATCAELLTQILNDNREAVNLMFESTKKMIKVSEKEMERYKELFPDEKDDDSPNTGFNVEEEFNL